MKPLFTIIAVLASLVGFSKNDISGDKFIIQGKIYELNIFDQTDKEANKVQIVIYQNQEIYASIYCKENGSYEFILPVGFEYELWFGGKEFVNKKVYVDSRSVPSRKASGYECNLDMGLFRPIDNVEFPTLVDHYVKVRWDNEYRQLLPDIEYSEWKYKEVEKNIKRARKMGGGY